MREQIKVDSVVVVVVVYFIQPFGEFNIFKKIYI